MNLREELYNHVVVEKKEKLKAVDTAEMVSVNVVDSCRIFTGYPGVNKIRDVIFKTFESAFPNGDDNVKWTIYSSENGSAVHKKVTEDIDSKLKPGLDGKVLTVNLFYHPYMTIEIQHCRGFIVFRFKPLEQKKSMKDTSGMFETYTLAYVIEPKK